MSKSFTFIFLLVTSAISAQFTAGDSSLEFGKTIPKEKGNIMTIAGVLNDSIYSLSRTKKDLLFQTYDARTKILTSSRPFTIPAFHEIKDYTLVGNKLFLMLSFYDEIDRNYKFIANEIQNNEIVKTTVILSVAAKRRFRSGDFIFKKTNDGSKYLVANTYDGPGNSGLNYSLVLVNEQLVKVFADANTIVPKVKRHDTFGILDISLSKDGNIIFVLSESYRDKAKKTKMNNLSIVTFQANNYYQQRNFKIKVEGKYIVDANLIPIKNNMLHITGFYTDLQKNGRSSWHSKGIYDIVINISNEEVIKKNFNDFQPFVYDIFPRKYVHKNKGLYRSWFKNIAFIERDDGGLFVLTEQNWKSEASRVGFPPLVWTSYVMQSKHVIITALNADGSLAWSNYLPKDQDFFIEFLGRHTTLRSKNTQPTSIPFPIAELGNGEEIISVLPIYKNGFLTLFYNDVIFNTSRTNVDELFFISNSKPLVTTAYTFNENTGERKRIDPENYPEDRLHLKPLIYYRISEKQYLIYGGNANYNALGEINIKE